MMMQRLPLLFAIVASSFLIETACGAPKALSRDAALKILKQQESHLLGRGDSFVFFKTTHWVPYWYASEAELSHQKLDATPPLSKLDELAPKDKFVSAWRKELAQNWLDGDFLLALGDANVIHILGFRNKSEYYGGWSDEPQGISFTIGRASASSLQLEPAPFDAKTIIATVTSDHFTRVTGIAGEGELRTVDVSIVHEATPTLKKLREVAWQTAQKATGDAGVYSDTCSKLPINILCRVLSYREPVESSATYTLRRYDDGWRLYEH